MRQVGDLVHPLSLYAVAGIVAKYIYILPQIIAFPVHGIADVE